MQKTLKSGKSKGKGILNAQNEIINFADILDLDILSKKLEVESLNNNFSFII